MLRASSLAEAGLVTYPWLVTIVTRLQTMLADNKKIRPANLTAAEKGLFGRAAVEVSGRDKKQYKRQGYCISQLCLK